MLAWWSGTVRYVSAQGLEASLSLSLSEGGFRKLGEPTIGLL